MTEPRIVRVSATYDSDYTHWFANAIARQAMEEMDRQVATLWTMNAPSWEEQLAWAIERRRIRNQPRRLYRSLRSRWWDWQQRLSLASDALRGRHECDW